MTRKAITYVGYAVLLAGLALRLAGVAQAAMGNIDPNDKYAWGTNVGWINFNPTHGGVTVYADHLEGYAWGENVGWIRMGTHTGGGSNTYGNTSATDYGVNRDGDGNLSGYAWGTNVGWINFNPTHSQVTIDRPPAVSTATPGGRTWAGFTSRTLLPTPYSLPSTLGGERGLDSLQERGPRVQRRHQFPQRYHLPAAGVEKLLNH